MKKQSSLISGRQPVLEELKAGGNPERIFIQKGAVGENISEIRQLAEKAGIPIHSVPAEKLNRLTRSNHQGIVAIASLVSYTGLEEIVDFLVGEGKDPFLLMLDGITDVRNIGAIARTAFCMGTHALILPDKGVGALNEEAVKSSAGALLKMQLCRVNSLLKAVDTLHQYGIRVGTADMRARKTIQETDFTGPCCIIMGSEDKGIQAYLSKASDFQFRIPMAPGFDSLNVSVAAGIILFEAFRQRS